MSLYQPLLSRLARATGVFLIAASALLSRAGTITNVTIVNVTPSSFSLVWRGPAAADAVQVYADANGQTNVTRQLGVEFYPLHTGNPNYLEGYERRQSRADLRAKTKALGLVQAKIRNGTAGATYYFKITSTSGGTTNTYPATGFASVQLPPENSFVINSQQLIIDMPGVDHAGYIVTLTHTNATHALAAVVGDGVGTNQVFFNLNDIFALTGGNLSPTNAQNFDVTVMGPPNSTEQQVYNVAFTDSFSVGGVTGNTTTNNFLIVNVGSGVFRRGDTNQLAISLNSTPLKDFSMSINLPDGEFDQLKLIGARGEIDPAGVSITKGSGSSYTLSFHSLTGSLVSGPGPAVTLSFVATNHTSRFVPIIPGGIIAHQADGSLLPLSVATSGRMVIVADQPLLESLVDTDGRKLTLYGNPLSSYEIQRSAVVGKSNQWQVVTRVPMTNLVYSLSSLNTFETTQFFRAREMGGDPPQLELIAGGSGLSNLRLFGASGGTYKLEYTANLSGVVQWNPLLTYTLTNSFTNIAGLQTTNGNRIYRVTR